MIIYRHNLILKRIRSKLGQSEIETFKLLGLFIVLFLVISFFGTRILNTLEQGYQYENRLRLLYQQVHKLENENKILRKEAEVVSNDAEVEVLYRSLGYKKPGEQIYLIEKPTPTVTSTPASDQSDPENVDRQNWQTWLMLLFSE